MRQLTEVEGIGAVYAQKLIDRGVANSQALLDKCATPAGRKALAGEMDVAEGVILRWANRVDLSRIKGVGEEYSDLLEASGVDTVPELAQRVAANLYQKMVEVNGAKNLVRKLPAESQVADWIAQAKALPRVLTY